MTSEDEQGKPHCKLDAAVEWARGEERRRQDTKDWVAANHMMVLRVAAETLHEIARARKGVQA